VEHINVTVTGMVWIYKEFNTWDVLWFGDVHPSVNYSLEKYVTQHTPSTQFIHGFA